MTNQEMPDSDDGITPALREYTSRRDIAALYDGYFRGMGLFDFDTDILDTLFQEPGRLLDVGCGTGRHLLHFARRGFDVTGVDLSDHMLEICRNKLQREGLTAHTLRSNFCKMQALADESFDYVICMFSTLGMVQHSRNRAAALAEMRRLLVPGGVFVMHAHNRLHNLWIPDGIVRLLKSYVGSVTGKCEAGDLTIDGYRGVAEMFLHSYTSGELKSCVESAGLALEKFLYLNESRTGLLRESRLSRLMANGFIVIAQKPPSRA